MKKLLFLLLYFASTVYSFSPSDIYNFSNGGASGNEGPTQDQVNTAYSGTTLDSQVTINTQGIQEWTVPQTGTYSIKVAGARGGGSYPSALFSDSVRNGFGAVIYATVSLTQGDVLKILVGQVGTNGSNEAGGGGGGTFVVKGSTPILIAGGGGSAGSGGGKSGAYLNGYKDGNLGQNGQNGEVHDNKPEETGAGGIAGQEGETATTSWNGFGGAGFAVDGDSADGTQSFLNGGVSVVNATGGTGGFGGGGSSKNYGGAGGGGYSGGGSNGRHAPGGGGGSFIISTATSVATSNGTFEGVSTFNSGQIGNLDLYNGTDGMVSISLNTPPTFSNTPYNFTALSGSSSGTLVGTVTASDGEPLTYSLSGADASSFTINSSGEIRSTTGLLKGIKAIHTFNVSADDGKGGFTTVEVNVNVETPSCSTHTTESTCQSDSTCGWFDSSGPGFCKEATTLSGNFTFAPGSSNHNVKVFALDVANYTYLGKVEVTQGSSSYSMKIPKNNYSQLALGYEIPRCTDSGNPCTPAVLPDGVMFKGYHFDNSKSVVLEKEAKKIVLSDSETVKTGLDLLEIPAYSTNLTFNFTPDVLEENVDIGSFIYPMNGNISYYLFEERNYYTFQSGQSSYTTKIAFPKDTTDKKFYVGYSRVRFHSSGDSVQQRTPYIQKGVYKSNSETVSEFGKGQVLSVDSLPENITLNFKEGTPVTINFTLPTTATSRTEVLIQPIRIGHEIISDFQDIDIDNGSQSGTISLRLPEGKYKFKYYVVNEKGLVGRGFYTAGRAKISSLESEEVTIENTPVTIDINSAPLDKMTEVNLKAGWNLVSLPGNLIFDPVDIYYFIGGVEEDDNDDRTTSHIAHYSPFLGWSYFYFNKESRDTRLTEISPTDGFWLKANKDGTKKFPVTEESDISPKVVTGWNLVGFQKDKTLEEIINNIESNNSDKKVTSVWVYRDGNWKVFYPQGEGTNTLNKTDSILKSEGIYIKVHNR